MTLKVIINGVKTIYEDRKISWEQSVDNREVYISISPSGETITLQEGDVAYINNEQGNTVDTIRVKKPVKEMKVVR